MRRRFTDAADSICENPRQSASKKSTLLSSAGRAAGGTPTATRETRMLPSQRRNQMRLPWAQRNVAVADKWPFIVTGDGFATTCILYMEECYETMHREAIKDRGVSYE